MSVSSQFFSERVRAMTKTKHKSETVDDIFSIYFYFLQNLSKTPDGIRRTKNIVSVPLYHAHKELDQIHSVVGRVVSENRFLQGVSLT